MKKYFLIAIMAMCTVNSSYAQEISRKGNTFISSRSSSKKDTLVTAYKYAVADVEYPIILSKASGACYIWKKSNKSGKMYKMYLPEEVTSTICKELGIKRKKSK